MTILEIPVRRDSYCFFETVALGDSAYMFSFRYNSRMGRWIMDIADYSGNPLLSGIPLLPSYPLTDKFIGKIPGLPPGNFVVIDETGAERIPGIDNLGVDIKLIYAEA